MANGPLNASGGIRIVVSFAVWCTQVEKQLPFWFWLTHHQHEYIDNRPLILMAVETAGLEVSALHLFVYTHSRTHTNEWKSLATHFALFLVVCLASADTNTHTRHPSTNWTARKTHQHQCASEPIALARRIYSVHRLFCCVCLRSRSTSQPSVRLSLYMYTTNFPLTHSFSLGLSLFRSRRIHCTSEIWCC